MVAVAMDHPRLRLGRCRRDDPNAVPGTESGIDTPSSVPVDCLAVGQTRCVGKQMVESHRIPRWVQFGQPPTDRILKS